MSDYNKKTIIKLLEIAKKYKYLKKWEEVILECETKIMSKGISIYGMFYPEKELCKYFPYSGRICKSDKIKDFEYFFDNLGRLKITHRCCEHSKRHIIYYNYLDDLIEIIWFNVDLGIVDNVGYIEYFNGQLIKFVESICFENLECIEDLNISYKEYIYNTEGPNIIKKVYWPDYHGKPYEFITNLKKF
jgi:hypothetical protein